MTPLSGYIALSPEEALKALVRFALAEDVGPGDWTTLWTVDEAAQGIGRIYAKQDLVVAGTAAAVEVFHAVDPTLAIEVLQGDGVRAGEGSVVMTIIGSLRPILVAERTALNFLGSLSGIATLTRTFVEEVSGTGARIVDTRKTTPVWRSLEKDAVRSGGGFNHRMGLYDMVLIKENHIAAAGGVRAAVDAVAEQNKAKLWVEVEVRDLVELEEAMECGVQRVMLDNMDLDTMRQAVERVRSWGDDRPEVEVSGNVTLERVREIAEVGVDLISVGALTHSAPTADLSLQVESVRG